MNRDRQQRRFWLLLSILILIILGLVSLSNAQPSTKDVVPIFVGPAACSGDVISVTTGDLAYEPVSWFGQNVYLIPNGIEYNVSWTAHSDVLGLAEEQTGIKGFVAGTDGMVNHPAICVSYTVQDGWR